MMEQWRAADTLRAQSSKPELSKYCRTAWRRPLHTDTHPPGLALLLLIQGQRYGKQGNMGVFQWKDKACNRYTCYEYLPNDLLNLLKGIRFEIDSAHADSAVDPGHEPVRQVESVGDYVSSCQ